MDAVYSPWRDRWVLVTGCTGFLGGAVTRELLARGARVVGLVRDRGRAAEFAREIDSGHVQIVPGRVEDTARLHSTMVVHEVSAVFHLAGSGRGFDSVRRATGLYHSRVPIISACPAYQLRVAAGDSPALVGTARFGELFGPRDRTLTRIVPQTILSLLGSERPKSMNLPARDFVFVRDAARACLTLAEAVQRAGHAIDCSFQSGWAFTDATIVELLMGVLAGRMPATRFVEPGHPHGWRPETSLADALRETIEWHKQSVRSNPSQPTITIRKAA